MSFRIKYQPPKILKNPEVLMLQYQGKFDQRKDGWHSSELRIETRESTKTGKTKSKRLAATAFSSLSRSLIVTKRWSRAFLSPMVLLCSTQSFHSNTTPSMQHSWMANRYIWYLGEFCYWSHVVLGLRSVPWQTERDVSITQRWTPASTMLDPRTSHISTKSLLYVSQIFPLCLF